MKRDLIAVIWSLLVTGAISKWAFHVAYLERGYKAVGGEYLAGEIIAVKQPATNEHREKPMMHHSGPDL